MMLAQLFAAKHRRALLHERLDAFLGVFGALAYALREGLEFQPAAEIGFQVAVDRSLG